MIIGLDFDNTIVKYDRAFHQVALEKGLIQADLPVSKLIVRDTLRANGHEDAWTEMQGYVYGCRMDLAEIYDGAIEFLKAAQHKNITCKIISHKTRLPYMGKPYDLHKAARDWIEKFLVSDGSPLIKPENISFHETKKLKISHIGNEACDIFLDDLPEILTDETFPLNTKSYLFDPDSHHQNELSTVRHWDAFKTIVGL